MIDATEAARIGLANRVVDDSELASAALTLAEQLATKPPIAIQGARRAIDAAWNLDSHESFRVAIEAQIRCLRSADFKEAIAALVESREPQWQGR